MHQAPDTHLTLFKRAVDLLGGQARAAQLLGMSDRSLRYVLAGTRPLHAGLLEDVAKALIEHADACRQIERQLSPAFAENREGLPAPHPNSLHAKRDRPAKGADQACSHPPGGMEAESRTLVRAAPSAAGGRE